ncbi:MAG: thiol:disulfide interchange protein [Robiginitomaculum sp.]|nr:MAG: thiol:disulfide interchange protein [Robiginitomaculum sp.]
MRRLLIIVPVLVLASLFGLFVAMILRGDKGPAISRLVGQNAAAFTLIALDGTEPVALADYAGQPVVINFFASWCTPCRAEHPILMDLAAQGITIIGINYKDRPEAARAFIEELGNPFVAIGEDANGRTGIDYGITGVPETFVIGADGTILTNWASPLDSSIIEKRIMPALKSAPSPKD